jgi:tRNA threonylcarbamoyladenosine biosynthesis protein TsaE
MKNISLQVNSLGETSHLASQIAKNIKGGEVICLVGELGVGKTYFIKFFCEALGVKGEDVISPTFVYWKKHKGTNFKINHFDFYRIADEKEVEDIGFADVLDQKDAVAVIEWADKIRSYLPKARLEIEITFLGQTEREIDLKTLGDKCDHLLEGIESNV